MAGHTVPETVYVGGAAVPTLGLIQLDGAGVGVVNLVVGGLLFLVVYLTLPRILCAVEKEDIINLRTLLGGHKDSRRAGESSVQL